MPRFLVEVQEVETTTFVVEAVSIEDARRAFVERGGILVSRSSEDAGISDVRPDVPAQTIPPPNTAASTAAVMAATGSIDDADAVDDSAGPM